MRAPCILTPKKQTTVSMNFTANCFLLNIMRLTKVTFLILYLYLCLVTFSGMKSTWQIASAIKFFLPGKAVEPDGLRGEFYKVFSDLFLPRLRMTVNSKKDKILPQTFYETVFWWRNTVLATSWKICPPTLGCDHIFRQAVRLHNQLEKKIT